MKKLELELKKPSMWISRGTLIIFDHDANFSSILYRPKGLFKLFKVVDTSFEQPTLKSIYVNIEDLMYDKKEYKRMQLNPSQEQRVVASALLYLHDLIFFKSKMSSK